MHEELKNHFNYKKASKRGDFFCLNSKQVAVAFLPIYSILKKRYSCFETVRTTLDTVKE